MNIPFISKYLLSEPPNGKLTGRQQCERKPYANDKIYTEEKISKKTLLLAVGCSFLLYGIHCFNTALDSIFYLNFRGSLFLSRSKLWDFNIDGLVKSQNFKLLPHYMGVVISKITLHVVVEKYSTDFLRDRQH